MPHSFFFLHAHVYVILLKDKKKNKFMCTEREKSCSLIHFSKYISSTHQLWYKVIQNMIHYVSKAMEYRTLWVIALWSLEFKSLAYYQNIFFYKKLLLISTLQCVAHPPYVKIQERELTSVNNIIISIHKLLNEWLRWLNPASMVKRCKFKKVKKKS